MNGTMRLTHNQYFAVLAGLFSLLWLALAVSPVSRSAWALENVLVVAFILSIWALREAQSLIVPLLLALFAAVIAAPGVALLRRWGVPTSTQAPL